jgi:mono/diheme cytochrome c family protein
LLVLACTSGVFCYAAQNEIPPAAARPVDFQVDIQPILSKHCYSCHGPDKQKADLRWDDKAVLSRKGDHGPVIIPGASAQSRVIRLVSGLEPETIMPAKGERLTPEQIGLLRAWIDQGANWPETGQAASIDKRNHWAFKTPSDLLCLQLRSRDGCEIQSIILF